MKIMTKIICAVGLLAAVSCGRQDRVWLAQAPADTLYTHVDRLGATIIPNGRVPGSSYATYNFSRVWLYDNHPVMADYQKVI